MAEGILKARQPQWEVYSAGTFPAERVHPKAVQVMREIGIDIAACAPKHVSQFLRDDFDYVVTVCDRANETCPIFMGKTKQRLHIGFEDPAAARGTESEVLAVFCRVRDQIKAAFSILGKD